MTMNDLKKWAFPGVALALLAGLLFGWAATAANGRSITGHELTYLLNGSPKYLGTISDALPMLADGGAPFTSNATTSTAFTMGDGEMVMVQCDEPAYIVNLAASNSGARVAKAVELSADEKFLFGMVSKGVPFVSVDTGNADGGAVNCKVFAVY